MEAVHPIFKKGKEIWLCGCDEKESLLLANQKEKRKAGHPFLSVTFGHNRTPSHGPLFHQQLVSLVDPKLLTESSLHSENTGDCWEAELASPLKIHVVSKNKIK